jgi:hypothetical protein
VANRFTKYVDWHSALIAKYIWSHPDYAEFAIAHLWIYLAHGVGAVSQHSAIRIDLLQHGSDAVGCNRLGFWTEANEAILTCLINHLGSGLGIHLGCELYCLIREPCGLLWEVCVSSGRATAQMVKLGTLVAGVFWRFSFSCGFGVGRAGLWRGLAVSPGADPDPDSQGLSCC